MGNIRKGTSCTNGHTRLRWHDFIDRGDNRSRWIDIGPHFHRFDDRYVLSGLFIEADFNRSFTTRIVAGTECTIATGVSAVFVGLMTDTTTLAMHDLITQGKTNLSVGDFGLERFG